MSTELEIEARISIYQDNIATAKIQLALLKKFKEAVSTLPQKYKDLIKNLILDTNETTDYLFKLGDYTVSDSGVAGTDSQDVSGLILYLAYKTRDTLKNLI